MNLVFGANHQGKEPCLNCCAPPLYPPPLPPPPGPPYTSPAGEEVLRAERGLLFVGVICCYNLGSAKTSSYVTVSVSVCGVVCEGWGGGGGGGDRAVCMLTSVLLRAVLACA